MLKMYFYYNAQAAILFLSLAQFDPVINARA